MTGKEINWLDWEVSSRYLVPDLADRLNTDSANFDDKLDREIARIYDFAYNMVRYAISGNPSDTDAIHWHTGEKLINPDTKKPFKLEDVGINRSRAIGTTTGIFEEEKERKKVIAELTFAMYKKLHPDI